MSGVTRSVIIVHILLVRTFQKRGFRMRVFHQRGCKNSLYWLRWALKKMSPWRVEIIFVELNFSKNNFVSHHQCLKLRYDQG